jgi:hypothetical protein
VSCYTINMDFFSMLNNINNATIKSDGILNPNDCVSSMTIDQNVINFLVEKYDIRAMHARKTKLSKRLDEKISSGDLKINKSDDKNDKL